MVLLNGADAPAPVAFYGHAQVAAALAKTTTFHNDPDLIVLGAHRDGPGVVEVHDHETDIVYVMDGSATMVTGGKMIGGKVTSPGQWQGTNIEGGESHPLTKGDVFVIRAGVPHWFK